MKKFVRKETLLKYLSETPRDWVMNTPVSIWKKDDLLIINYDSEKLKTMSMDREALIVNEYYFKGGNEFLPIPKQINFFASMHPEYKSLKEYYDEKMKLGKKKSNSFEQSFQQD